MSSERWRKVDELFCSALEIESHRRAEYLREACAGDQSLQEEVEALLACQQEAGAFIESPAVDDALGLIAVESGEPIANHRIGPYEIIREIGHGGMGAVFLAARADDAYKKQVAIKVVKRGFDNSFITTRFRAERQILANLDHPNIARLLDGGATEEGLPYLVMEYIEGLPIDQYCDERSLSTTERLKLFRVSCSAVQYAHQNLVIHRDIKPSNILVTEGGTPKLLDFGIAKILRPDAEQQTQTATAARMMTPDYASPEQVRGESITTASDIYSLGVLLYKLLTGRHPYRFKTLLPQEIERVICETAPERPSTAVSRVEEGMASDGVNATTPRPVRGKPEKLRRVLGGDLDNIVLMAMRKEPARRYSSVEQFAEDIRRHLTGLPVIARRDTFSYRAGKFVTRHRASVAAAVLIAMTLIAGIIATVWQARVARAERDKARSEQAKSQRINAFLQSVLQYANPAWYSAGKDKGPKTTVLDALNDAAKRVETEFTDEPEVRADLHQTMGDTYRALEFYDEAEHHFRSSLEIRRRLYGENSVRVAENIFYLGAVQNAKGNYAEAEPLCRQALAIQRLNPDEGNNLPFIIQELTASLSGRGDVAACEALDREALDIFRRRYGTEDIRVAFAHFKLGTDYFLLGDLEKAKTHSEEALRLLRHEPDYRSVAVLGLGEICTEKGEYQEAEPMLREALETTRNIYRNAPSEGTANLLMASYFSLVRLLCLRSDYAEASVACEQLAGILEQIKHREQPNVVVALRVLGQALARIGQHTRAESYLREALATASLLMIDGSWLLAETKGALGECLMGQARYGEAEPLLVESYETLKSNQVPQSFRLSEAIGRLVNLYEALRNEERVAAYRGLLSEMISHK